MQSFEGIMTNINDGRRSTSTRSGASLNIISEKLTLKHLAKLLRELGLNWRGRGQTSETCC